MAQDDFVRRAVASACAESTISSVFTPARRLVCAVWEELSVSTQPKLRAILSYLNFISSGLMKLKTHRLRFTILLHYTTQYETLKVNMAAALTPPHSSVQGHSLYHRISFSEDKNEYSRYFLSPMCADI
jgi:hypothetical protein